MKYLHKLSEATKFGLFGTLSGHSYNASLTSGEVSYLEADDGEHKLSTCHTSDLFYFVIEGQGKFMVGGERFPVNATDVIVVPKNTEYGYKGSFRYVLFMTPPFTEGCETRTNRSIDEA